MSLSNRSLNNLKGVDPDLVSVIIRAAEIHKSKGLGFTVIEGVRTEERQAQLYAQGRTTAGKIVTWTMESRHFVNPKTGYGEAVDLLPDTGWNDLAGFDAMADSVFTAARELKVSIRWGADWDRDGKRRERGETDSPHFEKVRGGTWSKI